ncbi:MULTISPECIES: DUF3791 domain-containing protein [unclassified Adlercreutzia]|uniref:DUF3791 domain-containing protein n=1 Tax=unclassified Adlercreutzia TaxID=2636013 RepID=UPI0013EB5032|nr:MULTISPECIES: DUF3791 domain-containing protein [unclassified Adlercreutzia]
MNESTRREIDFAVFLIYRLAESWGKTVPETYRTLADLNVLGDYVIPFYDVLHTQGEQCLVDEITELARRRGAVI